MPKILEDLIFEPFEIGCPKCYRRTAVDFEVLRLNQEIICAHCENRFFANKNVSVLTEMIKVVESPETRRVNDDSE